MLDINLRPVEEFILDGLVDRCSKVFKCPAAYGNAVDRIQIIKKMMGGKPVTYPYIFVNVQRLAANSESYQSMRMSRTGIPCIMEDDNRSVHNVRLIATNFEMEVVYVTNKISGDIRQDHGLAFQRRWMFARRAGSLKFNVRYGNLLRIPIGITLGESVDTPTLENKTETEAQYEFVGNLTVHGYVSEPDLAQTGVIQTVAMGEVLATMPNAVFVPFD